MSIQIGKELNATTQCTVTNTFWIIEGYICTQLLYSTNPHTQGITTIKGNSVGKQDLKKNISPLCAMSTSIATPCDFVDNIQQYDPHFTCCCVSHYFSTVLWCANIQIKTVSFVSLWSKKMKNVQIYIIFMFRFCCKWAAFKILMSPPEPFFCQLSDI